MKRSIPCEHCGCSVMPTKRNMDLRVALFNHIRLSHPDVKMSMIVHLGEANSPIPQPQEQTP